MVTLCVWNENEEQVLKSMAVPSRDDIGTNKLIAPMEALGSSGWRKELKVNKLITLFLHLRKN